MSEGMTASSQNSAAPTKMPQKASQSWTYPKPQDSSLPTATSVAHVTGSSAEIQDPQASASDSSPAPQEVFPDNSANFSPTPTINQAPQALPSSSAEMPQMPQSNTNEISQTSPHSSTTLAPTSTSQAPQAAQGSPASLAPKPVPTMTQSPTAAFSPSVTPTLKPPVSAAGSNSMSTLGSTPTLKIESSPTKPSGVLDTGLSPNSPISNTRTPLIASRAPLSSVSPPTKGPSLPQPVSKTTKAPVVVPPTQTNALTSTTPPNSYNAPFASRPAKPPINLNNNVFPMPTLPPVGELHGAPMSFVIKPVNPLPGTASPSPSSMRSYPTSPSNLTMPSANAPNLPSINSSSVAPTPTPSPTRSAPFASRSPKPPINLNDNVFPMPTLPPVDELHGAPMSFVIKPVNPLPGTASPSPSSMRSYPTSPSNLTMPSANAPNLPSINSSSVATSSMPTRFELNRKRLFNNSNEHATSIESSLEISYSRNYAQQQHPMPESPSWLAAHGFIVLGGVLLWHAAFASPYDGEDVNGELYSGTNIPFGHRRGQ
eukprot:CAMPEP_0172434212 /NCGR_PEP_ID=MMETSP1064-20121228/70511_1 /TAXON_ID=202472 /ORGANISM="Aulacoseira subarctica , Strain CCAP 1002/5" /LENGTH=541 /DNA_ID=CAMNT_0013182415 /DNA_START=355 /DNA_END=1981 /DNA_ORIENTATION=-